MQKLYHRGKNPSVPRTFIGIMTVFFPDPKIDPYEMINMNVLRDFQ